MSHSLWGRIYTGVGRPLPEHATAIDAWLLCVFAAEGIVNTASSLYMFLFPTLALQQLGRAAPLASEALLLQW